MRDDREHLDIGVARRPDGRDVGLRISLRAGAIDGDLSSVELGKLSTEMRVHREAVATTIGLVDRECDPFARGTWQRAFAEYAREYDLTTGIRVALTALAHTAA